MVATTLTALVSNPYAKKKYLVILKPYDFDTSGEVSLYFSGEGFVTSPTDTPANTLFEPRLVEPISFSRSMFSSGKIGGFSVPGFGELILTNADGGLDDFATYAWDGRSVEVKVGEAGGEVDPNFPRRMMQEGVAAIADSYTKEGLFSRPWSEVQTQMREDILPVLEQGFLQADMKFRDAELQSLDPQQREIQMESLRMNSLMAARAAFEGVSDELYERHTQQERGTYKSSIGYLQNFLKNLDHRERGYKKTFPDRTDADVKRSEVERGGGQNALPGGVAFP